MKKNTTDLVTTMEIQDYPLWEKLKRKRIPLSFELELTARCNMNCRHCYINLPASDLKAKAEEMSFNEIIDYSRQAVELGSLWCLITGGEPLLRDDFEEIYLALKRLGLMMSVFTNATLIQDKHIQLFLKFPPRDIEITVYGVTQDTYEKVTRKKGSFKQFSDGLEKLRSNGIPVRLKSMAIQSNYHEHSAISTFCKLRTKDYYRFDPQLHLRYDRDPVRNKEIISERLTPEQIVDLESHDEERLKNLQKNCENLINLEPTHEKHETLLYCSAGINSFSISYNGIFRLCSTLRSDKTAFDLKTGCLSKAWNEFVFKVHRIKSDHKSETCRNCSLLNLCLWCPAQAFLETGDLEGFSSYFCEVAKRRAEMILGKKNPKLLKINEKNCK